MVLTTAASHANDDNRSSAAIHSALRSPISKEIQLQARQFDQQLLKTKTLNDQSIEFLYDQRLSRVYSILSGLTHNFQLIANAPEYWNLSVLDTNPKTENAFVVGGNYIYVYSGLVDATISDDELAFVLAHEMSHSVLKHQLRRSEDITNAVATLIGVGASLSKSHRSKGLGLAAGIITGAYSREDEREADALGAVIAYRAGYNPSHGATFFARQLKETRDFEAADYQIVEMQLAQCEQLKQQWYQQPWIHTQENAKAIVAVCDTSIVNARQLAPESKLESLLLRTHPLDADRISSLSAISAYLHGTRSLASLSSIGQGYNVLLALKQVPYDSNGAEGMPPVRQASSQHEQERMKTCNAEAKTKGLSGDARKQFMSSCLSN